MSMESILYVIPLGLLLCFGEGFKAWVVERGEDQIADFRGELGDLPGVLVGGGGVGGAHGWRRWRGAGVHRVWQKRARLVLRSRRPSGRGGGGG